MLHDTVADKGDHSTATMVALKERTVRSYSSKSKRECRNGTRARAAQQPTYANRRRIRGKALLRQCSATVERTLAHLLVRVRRVYVRGQQET